MYRIKYIGPTVNNREAPCSVSSPLPHIMRLRSAGVLGICSRINGTFAMEL